MHNILPRMPATGNISTQIQTAFGGINHNDTAANGAIYDMLNLSSAHMPLIAPRAARYHVKTLTAPNGIFADDRLFLVDGGELTVDGVKVGTLSNTRKTFCGMTGRVIILPDKVVYADGKLEPMEATYSAAGLVFGNGTYAEVPAEANSITTTDAAFPFRVGDAVEISGCRETANNKTPIIREISDDGKTLRFYEYTFTLPEGATSITETGTVTLARKVPDLDFICANENRLWGCKDDTIYASKLGDPFNWYAFEGISTDAWSVNTGTAGKFTGCVSYLGYPIFFKENGIFKVYGAKPSNYQVMASATLGVEAGSERSLAVAGETLYYLSRSGVAAYTGGVPSIISAPLGGGVMSDAAAGSDGRKYYMSVRTEDGTRLFVFDTQAGAWHAEDDLDIVGAAYLGGLYALSADGRLQIIGAAQTIPAGAAIESGIRSAVEFGDFDFENFASKYPVRLRLRFSAKPDAEVTAYVSFDGGAWETVKTVTGAGKRSVYLPVPIRRCDHFRLKIEAVGEWKLYALAWELHSGNYVRR